jgi:hypothetical protein
MVGAKIIIKGLEEAVAFVKAMSPEDHAAMIEAQRQSWVRGMAPCEHGVADWEDCGECRSPTPNADEGEV